MGSVWGGSETLALYKLQAREFEITNESVDGTLMSLNMLIETPGGLDYTSADCMGWMKEAGFSSTRVESLVGPDSMVVGIK